MPYITEELWQKVKMDGESIMLADFPKSDDSLVNDDAEKEFDYLKEVITAIRNIRGEVNVPPSKKIEIIFKTKDNSEKVILEENSKILDKLSNVEKYAVDNDKEIPKLTGFRLAVNTEIFVPLAGLIDTEKEIAKLMKDIEKTDIELKRVLGKLSNEKFLSKAPKDVVEKENSIKEELENKLNKLKENIELYKKS